MKTKPGILTVLLLILILSVYAQREGDWTTLNPQNPPEAREGHSMVTLPDGRVMMFGGEVGASWFNDLHAYEDANWSEITPNNSPPPARSFHDAWMEGDQMYIYGGMGDEGPVNDMWAYDIVSNEWVEHVLSGTIPPARYGHTTTATSNGTKLILGGKDSEGNKLNDFYKVNPDFSCSQMADAPALYYNHVSHLIDDDFFFVLGKAGHVGLYQLSAGVWGETAGGFPLNEINSSVTTSNAIFAFGGIDASGNLTNNVYVFNTSTGVVTSRENPLPAMIENGAAAKYYGNSKNPEDYTVLMFGGVIDGAISNTTYMSNDNLLSIEDITSDSQFDIKIYNNSSGFRITANKEIQWVQLMNIQGKLVKEINTNNMDVSLTTDFLIPGIYIIKLSLDNQQISRKVLIQL